MTESQIDAKYYHTSVPVYEDTTLKFSDVIYRGLVASLALASFNAFALMVIVIRLAL